MCGRFGLAATAAELMQHFGLAEIPDWQSRYNMAPGQSILGIVSDPSFSRPQLRSFQWGLIPSWAKEPKPMINARAETLTEKPSFKTALRQRRCLIPADGFYEWKGQGKSKQPFHIGLKEGSLFSFAGIWESWQTPEGKVIQSCAIITTTANPLIQGIHERMPVILNPQDYALWLNPTILDPRVVVPLLTPYPAEAMTTYPVSNRVNRPQFYGASCREKVDAGVN